MGGVADLLIAIANLLEAEGKAFRRGLMRFWTGCLLLFASLLFILSGFALVVWGIYQLLACAIGDPAGALVTGAIGLIIAIALMGSARLATR